MTFVKSGTPRDSHPLQSNHFSYLVSPCIQVIWTRQAPIYSVYTVYTAYILQLEGRDLENIKEDIYDNCEKQAPPRQSPSAIDSFFKANNIQHNPISSVPCIPVYIANLDPTSTDIFCLYCIYYNRNGSILKIFRKIHMTIVKSWYPQGSRPVKSTRFPSRINIKYNLILMMLCVKNLNVSNLKTVAY